MKKDGKSTKVPSDTYRGGSRSRKSNVAETKVEKKTQKMITKKDESSSSEEMSSSESDKEQIKRKAMVSFLRFGGAVNNRSKNEDTSDDSDEDSSDESDSEDEKPSNKAESSEESSSDDEERLRKKIKIGQVAKKASSSSSEEESDSPEELPSKTVKKSDTDVKMVDAPSPSKAIKTSQNPITRKATGPKTLFIGNLSDSIEKNDVINFFKDAGEIVEVRFSVRENQFAGYGNVEFATVEAAHEALKLNNKMLKGRPVTVDLPKQTGADTPGGSSNKKPFQKRKQAQGTVFIRGFDASDSIENIKSSLQNHFEICGETTRIIVPRDNDSGLPTGTAYIDFAHRNGFYQALKLDGSYIKGRAIMVNDARPITDSCGYENDESTGGFDGGRGRFGSRNNFGERCSGVNIGGRCGSDNVGKPFGGRRPYPGARCGSIYARQYLEFNRQNMAPRGTGKKTVFDE